MYEQPKGPQSIGAVLDSGFALFAASFKQTFHIAAAVALLTAPLALLGQLAAVARTDAAETWFALALALFVVIAFTGMGTIIARIDAVASGRELSLGAALRIGFARVVLLSLCTVIVVVATITGFVLLIVPGLVLIIYVMFAPYLVVTNRLGPLASIGYSVRLVRGHWWRTAAIVTIIGAIALALYSVLSILLAVAVATNPEAIAAGRMPWYINFVVSPLVSAVATPLGYSLLIGVLHDLELRYRGDDLAARIATA